MTEKVNEKLKNELISMRDFLDKAKKVESLLHPKGTNDFIESIPDLKNEIISAFPGIRIDQLSLCFRKQVMWKRNNIVHVGQFKYSHQEALETLNYSRIFIKVFEMMDDIKARVSL